MRAAAVPLTGHWQALFSTRVWPLPRHRKACSLHTLSRAGALCRRTAHTSRDGLRAQVTAVVNKQCCMVGNVSVTMVRRVRVKSRHTGTHRGTCRYIFPWTTSLLVDIVCLGGMYLSQWSLDSRESINLIFPYIPLSMNNES